MSSVVAIEQRLGPGLGGSQIAAAVGLHPYCPPIKVWLELTGRASPFEGNAATRWGQILEPVIRGVYVETHKVEVEIPTESSYHPINGWARATPDGFVVTPLPFRLRERAVSIKSVGYRQAHRWDNDDVPAEYRLQGAWEMYVCNVDEVDVVALIGGQDLREVRLYRDRDLERELVAAATEFWSCVTRDVPPEIDESDDWRRHLESQLVPGNVEIGAPPDLDELVATWRDLTIRREAIDDEEGLIKNIIRDALARAGATRLKTSCGPIKASRSERRSRDWERLAREYALRLNLAASVHEEADAPWPRALGNLIEPVDIAADIERHTALTPVWTLRRPNSWTTKDDE